MKFNPFKESLEEQQNDDQLIRRILEGSDQDLEKLICRHQAWIYNIALKMVMDTRDAEDVTQEILIKMLTKLSQYDAAKGAFRTWLYRIVVNHVLNMKKRQHENRFASLDECAAVLETIPDQRIDITPESKILIEELKIKCWTGMLLCLNRQHRIVFILGGIFNVNDTLGSELLNVSKVNFRKMLSRSREKVSNFMTHNCGLIHENNPCHCAKKLKGLIDQGFIVIDKLFYYQVKVRKIKHVVAENMAELEKLFDSRVIKLFREHPFYDPPDLKRWIYQRMARYTFKEL